LGRGNGYLFRARFKLVLGGTDRQTRQHTSQIELASPNIDFMPVHSRIFSKVALAAAFCPFVAKALLLIILIGHKWKYHRTARIIFHTHLLEAILRLESMKTSENMLQMKRIGSLKDLSTTIIQTLADEVLSTVSQSLAGTNPQGKILEKATSSKLCSGSTIIIPFVSQPNIAMELHKGRKF